MLAGPAIIVMVVILLYPLAYSFVMSFFRWDLGDSTPFIGVRNYSDALSGHQFQQSLRNQIIFSIISIAIEVCAGMGIAVLVNSKLHGLRLARTLLLIPPMIAPAVVGLNFRWLFNEQYGFLDAILRDLHLPIVPWLSDPNWALTSVIIADVWQNTPLMVLLFLAGLQSLPVMPHARHRLVEARLVEWLEQVVQRFGIERLQRVLGKRGGEHHHRCLLACQMLQ